MKKLKYTIGIITIIESLVGIVMGFLLMFATRFALDVLGMGDFGIFNEFIEGVFMISGLFTAAFSAMFLTLGILMFSPHPRKGIAITLLVFACIGVFSTLETLMWINTSVHISTFSIVYGIIGGILSVIQLVIISIYLSKLGAQKRAQMPHVYPPIAPYPQHYPYGYPGYPHQYPGYPQQFPQHPPQVQPPQPHQNPPEKPQETPPNPE